jgi:hypothetical protein
MTTFSMSDAKFQAAHAAHSAAASRREARFGLRPGNVQVGDLLVFPGPKKGLGKHVQVEWAWLGTANEGHLLVPLDERASLAGPLDLVLSEDEAPFGGVVRTDQAVLIGQKMFNKGQRVWRLPATSVTRIRERMSALVTVKKFTISSWQLDNDGDEEAAQAASEVEACRLHLEKLDAKAR